MSKEELVAAESTPDGVTEVRTETVAPAGSKEDESGALPDLRIVIDGTKAATSRRERSAQ
jgi:hypothetical protein